MQIEELYQKYLSAAGVTTDTRNIATGSIFFALKGEKFNANAFAAEALDKGAAFVVVDEINEPAWKDKYGEQLIVVDDVLSTLQQLAAHHRQQLTCPVLAITGSNGKTTTKELVAAVLSKKYKAYATKGNLNNHIGIPLTLLNVKSDVEFAVIEMGANHVGEIGGYCEYVAPAYGLITNVGMAHTEGFGGFEGVVQGKTELYKYLAVHNGKVFIEGDNDLLLDKAGELGLKAKNIITYAESEAYCTGEVEPDKEFLSVIIHNGDDETVIETNLVGEYNFENVLSAVCIGVYFEVELPQIKEAIEAYVPSNNRSQKIAYGSNSIILDAYNANPSSMAEALKNFDKIEAANKVAILGQMMELGSYASEQHKKIAQQAADMDLAMRVFVGDGFSFLKDEPGMIWFETTEEVKQWFKEQAFENSLILIKGSRKNELEKIIKAD